MDDLIPVSEESLEVEDELLLLLREVAALDSRPKVIGPSKPATLAASH